MLRCAILGGGRMGRRHAAVLATLPDAAVTWVFDRHASRAEALAGAHGARATTDATEAIAASDVDAVIVAVPTDAHRPMTELAAAHGKHVFCEKPIARTLADADAMMAACRRAGVRLMVGQVARFFAEYERAAALLHAGALGEVGVARVSRVNRFPRTARDWYADFDRSGGPVLDLMIHDLDTLRWYFGEVTRVYAHQTGRVSGDRVTACAQAVLRFANGVIAHAEASWAHARFRTRLEVAGAAGTLQFDSDESRALRLESTAAASPAGVMVPEAPRAENPYARELRHFVEGVATGAPFLVEGDEGTRSLAAALAVLDSATTGRPVVLVDGRAAGGV